MREYPLAEPIQHSTDSAIDATLFQTRRNIGDTNGISPRLTIAC